MDPVRTQVHAKLIVNNYDMKQEEYKDKCVSMGYGNADTPSDADTWIQEQGYLLSHVDLRKLKRAYASAAFDRRLIRLECLDGDVHMKCIRITK